jgi:hypothetical protein
MPKPFVYICILMTSYDRCNNSPPAEGEATLIFAADNPSMSLLTATLFTLQKFV